MQFKDLEIGQYFVFDDVKNTPMENLCVKTSERRYRKILSPDNKIGREWITGKYYPVIPVTLISADWRK